MRSRETAVREKTRLLTGDEERDALHYEFKEQEQAREDAREFTRGLP